MKKTIFVLVALLGLAGLVAMTDPDPTSDVTEGDVFLSPIAVNPYQEPEGAVDLMAPCGSFEHDGCWDMQPASQVHYEPARASDGVWVLVQGRIEPDPFKLDEIAYYCWPAHTLDDYMHFVLYGDKECTTNDVHRLNWSRMSLIIFEDGRWRRLTSYFGLLEHDDCGIGFKWISESYWFDGLEAYTDHPICLSIESLFPGTFRSYFWRDDFRLMGYEVTDRVYLPNVMRNY